MGLRYNQDLSGFLGSVVHIMSVNQALGTERIYPGRRGYMSKYWTYPFKMIVLNMLYTREFYSVFFLIVVLANKSE